MSSLASFSRHTNIDFPKMGVSLWGDGERDLCLNELFGMSRNVFNCRTGSDKGT
ncbi:hypothetical protein ARMGADRAFT_80534 [Armillaria gallica]|uniref:Uncharacterized protein n=1 Tax=Armillaria gallica TaxID=47427 RepID=A0A2H3CB36_ARMGA|nr:hypothetical protein ARMGADRAFT_80534 [Armillaria gallica]